MAINSDRPIYLQIADSLTDDILAGRYQPDSRIPSVRELSAMMQVNVNTAMRAVEQLERNKIIYNRRGLGYFTANNAVELIAQQRRDEFFKHEIDYFFNRLSQIGMDSVELLQRYETYLKLKQ
ncbi:MAG: GntR family transcriptional regulator [Bacteroidales bacterium]|nr:GntR family transcriptional regulator [Bacteroidales bacterium]